MDCFGVVFEKKSSNKSAWVDAARTGRGFAFSFGLTGVGESISIIVLSAVV